MMGAWEFRPNTPLEQTIRGCMGKAQYRTEAFALQVRRECELKRNAWLRVYHCGLCDRWHLARHIGGLPRCGVCLEVFQPRSRDEWCCEGCR